MKEVIEVFKDVKGFEGLYQVSDLGNVKSLKRVIKRADGIDQAIKERILKSSTNSKGYLNVTLHSKGKTKNFEIHNLLARTFLNHIPNGNKGLVADHRNNNKLDNKLSNLQLISHRLNLSKDKKNKTSKYTGVSWIKGDNKWICSITINGRKKHLGLFKTEIEAHERYQLELSKL